MNEKEYFIHLESNTVWLAREYYIWTGFHCSVDSNYAVALLRLLIGLKNLALLFLNQSSKTKTKTN